MTRRLSFVPAALLACAVAWGPARAQDDDPRTKPVFDAGHSLADVLNAARSQGKGLVLVLRGGTSYAGRVKQVGAHAVVLTELRGKEFFDAWIPLDAIVAMEERVRLR